MRARGRTWSATLVLLLLAFGGGCSSNNHPSSGGTGGMAGTSGGSGAGAGGSGNQVAPCNSSSTLDLSGAWAAKVEMTVKTQSQAGGEIQICPTPQTAQTTLYMLFNLEQDVANPKSLPTIQAHVCSVELPPVTAVAGTCDGSSNPITAQLLIPPALQSALPNVQLNSGSATLDGTAPGAGITSSQVVFVAGAATQGAQLPKWDASSQACSGSGIGTSSQCDTTCVQSCSALRDDDHDSYPGITLGVCGKTQSDQQQNVPCNTTDPSQAGATLQGKAFLDLQINPTLTGTVQSSCEVTGNVNAALDYNVVGADVTLVGSSPLPVAQVVQALPTFNVDPSQSEFKLLRVDGKDGSVNWQLPSATSAACAVVLAHQNDF